MTTLSKDCFLDDSVGTIVGKPNNICTVGWFSWTLRLTAGQANDLFDYLAVVSFHERKRYGGFSLLDYRRKCRERSKFDFSDTLSFTLDFPSAWQKYVASYFMGVKYFKHREITNVHEENDG